MRWFGALWLILAASGCGFDVPLPTPKDNLPVVKDSAPESAPPSSAKDSSARKPGIPAYAYEVLDHVRKTDRAPDGFEGGRTFQNREKRLAAKGRDGKSITYREWDVKRKVPGVNRGAERIVTGSDDSAWYTKDHYESFERM